MFSRNVFSLLIIGSALVSCKNEETPKVIYEAEKDNVEFQKIDSTQIKIADLPILIKGTDYLLHPIGDVRVYSGGSSSKFGSSKTKHVSYKISNYNYPEITGYLSNVMFQHKDSLDLKPLTQNKMQIQSITFLDELALKGGKKLLVYTLADKDTNRDGKYDFNDVKSLYISNSDGTNFTKLTPEFQELLDWNVVLDKNRLYFRSVEDINKNGEFDSQDTINYYYIDLNDSEWNLQTYSPLK